MKLSTFVSILFGIVLSFYILGSFSKIEIDVFIALNGDLTGKTSISIEETINEYTKFMAKYSKSYLSEIEFNERFMVRDCFQNNYHFKFQVFITLLHFRFSEKITL